MVYNINIVVQVIIYVYKPRIYSTYNNNVATLFSSTLNKELLRYSQ